MASSTSTCIVCGEEKDISESYCHSCTAAMNAVMNDTELQSEESNKKCPGCGSLLHSPDSVYCSACETAMKEIASPETSQKDSKEFSTPDASAKRKLDFESDVRSAEEDLVMTIRIRSPSSAIRQKFLEAHLTGELVNLLSQDTQESQDSVSSPCIITQVKTADNVVVERFKKAEKEGEILCVSSSQSQESPNAPCMECHKPVEESWMTKCQSCFKSGTSSRVFFKSPGRCLRCSGVTDASWKQYCTACFAAKIGGDFGQQIANSATRGSSPLRRSKCIDCGQPTSESWMTRCRPCYNEFSDSRRKKAKASSHFDH